MFKCGDWKEVTIFKLGDRRKVIMFKCGDCGETFIKPRIQRESRGKYWGMPAYEDVATCPYCGSEFIDIINIIENNSDKVLTN